MRPTVYHTIMFNYQGQSYFLDCVLNRRMTVDDLLNAFVMTIFNDQLLDAPITDIEFCIDHDPVFKCELFDHRQGLHTINVH